MLVTNQPGLAQYVDKILHQLKGALYGPYIMRAEPAAQLPHSRGALRSESQAEDLPSAAGKKCLTWLSRDRAAGWLNEGNLQKLVLVISSVATQEVLERWVSNPHLRLQRRCPSLRMEREHALDPGCSQTLRCEYISSGTLSATHNLLVSSQAFDIEQELPDAQHGWGGWLPEIPCSAVPLWRRGSMRDPLLNPARADPPASSVLASLTRGSRGPAGRWRRRSQRRRSPPKSARSSDRRAGRPPPRYDTELRPALAQGM